jgi:hypothetical protein
MFKLAMTPAGTIDIPALRFDEFDRVTDFHFQKVSTHQNVFCPRLIRTRAVDSLRNGSLFLVSRDFRQ